MYNLIIRQQSNLIWASFADELQKGEWKFEEKNPVVFADQMNQLKTTAPKTIIFKLPTPYSFDLNFLQFHCMVLRQKNHNDLHFL